MDHVFWLALFLVLALGVAGALLKLRERDKCLRLFDGHRVSYLGGRRATLWGTLRVVNKGLQLEFDRALSPGEASADRTSALLYEAEYSASVALCRAAGGPQDGREAERELQVRATFDPDRRQRVVRAARNLLYTVRDAVGQALGFVSGQISKTSTVGSAVAPSSARVATTAGQVVQFIGNAYEELLERQIGKPVVLELDPPPGSGSRPLELSGHLVDYTERFLAVFNVEHTVEASHVLELDSARDDHGLRASLVDGQLELTSRSALPLVVRRVNLDGAATDLGVVLLHGSSLTVAAPGAGGARVEFDVTRTIDVVCPRASARVRFGAAPCEGASETGWNGTAPTVGANAEATR